ncbi:hypothetical protein D3C72_1160400 [compost metagenome]
MRPGAGGGNEGIAQKHRLAVSLRRTGQRSRQIGRFAQDGGVLGIAPGMCQKHRIVPQAAAAQKRFEPVAQSRRIPDAPILHRLFKSTGIGKTANRKGRRHPGHEPQQRGNAAIFAHGSAVIVMAVAVIMAVGMTAMGMISAARRLERLFDITHGGAKTFQHGADDVVTQDENTLLLDLRGKMPVAQMPGKLDQVKAILRLDFEELFVSRADLDQVAVFHHEKIAMGKKHGFLQVEHYHLVILQMQQLAAKMPLVMRKSDITGRFVGGGSGRMIGGDAQHGMIRFRNSLGVTIFDG